MRRVLVCLLIAGVLCPATGCGGKLSQEDMRRHAIRRKRDQEDAAEPEARKQNAGGAVAQAPQSDATGGRPPRKSDRDSAHTRTTEEPAAPSIAHQADRRSTETPPPEPPKQTPAPATDPSAQPASDPGATAAPRPTLGPVERRQRSLDNLAKIGQALRSYTQAKKQLFASASYDALGRPLLSWRVELLPYLGYQELYDEFALDQPWDSPRNKALLASIPEVYQSPERFDEKTNYLVLRASFTPFGGRPSGISLASVEDGPANTVAVLEVDDVAAVPWTKPVDMEVTLSEFRKQAGTLREDGVFVVWLDGSVGRLLTNCSDAELRAVLSHDAGDSFAEYSVRAAATAIPAQADPQPATGTVVADPPADQRAQTVAAAMPVRQEPPLVPAPPAAESARARLPIPDPLSMEQARKLVRELYQAEYASQKDAHSQLALAQRMLKQADDVSEDPAGQYVLLDTVLKIATNLGDVTIAISALDQLLEHYKVDELKLTHETLTALAKKDRDRAGASQLLTKARGLIDQAIRDEQFETAESLCQIATRAARQIGDREAASQLIQQAEFVADCEKAFRDVQRALTSASAMDEPERNLHVGRYYCFLQGQWEKGLPLLAEGSDTRLQQLAEAELKQPTIPADQLKLADGWWDLATNDSAYQQALRGRAAYWYERALPELPNGLWRAKAELRLRECRRNTGTHENDE